MSCACVRVLLCCTSRIYIPDVLTGIVYANGRRIYCLDITVKTSYVYLDMAVNRSANM